MDWRHLLALALAIESTETFIACCDALLDGISLEEVPDLCHAIITHHLIGPNILIRRNSAALLGKVCHLHSASLVEVVSKSLSDGELGRFMDLDTDRIVLEAADTFFFDVISTTVDDICRLYDKSWLDGQNKELKKVLMSSSYSDDTKSAFKYVDVDVSEVISIPPQSKAKRTSNAYKPPSVGINNDVENECALHMMGRTDETWLARLVRFTITKLVSKEWEKREGAALGLHAMLTCLQDTDSIDNRFHILPPFLLADISCIGFASLVKDAIMDFGLDSDHNTSSVGDNLLSPLPLKEILSKLVCRAVYSLNAPDVTAKLLADTCKVMQSDKHWLVTCTGLILACDTFDLFPLSAECVLLVLQVFSSILSVTTHPREVYHYSEKLCRRLSRYCLSHSSQPIPLQGLCCAMSMSELCYLGSEDAVVLCNFVSMVCMSLTLMSSLNPTAEKNDSKESLITSFANLIGALTPSNVDILPVSYLIQVTEDILSVLRLVLNGQCKVGAESLQNLLACLIKPTSILFANPLPHAVDELHSIKELSELRHGARQLSMASNKLGNLLAEIVSQASDVQVTVLTLVNSLLSSFANSSKLFSMNFTSMLATMFSSLSRSGVLSSSLFSSITSSFKSLYASAGLDSAAEIGADNIKKRKFSLIVNDKIFPSPISQSDAASAIAIMTLVKLCSLSILVSCGQPTSELCDFLAGCLNRLQSLNPSLKSWLADYVCFATSLPHKEVSIPQLVNSINAALLLPESKHEVCLALLAPLVRFANLGESCNDLLQSFQHVGQHCLGFYGRYEKITLALLEKHINVRFIHDIMSCQLWNAWHKVFLLFAAVDSLCSRPDSLLASRAISTACFAPKAVTVVSLLACSFDELSSVHHNLLCRLTGSMLIALYESERDVLNLFCHALHACMFENRTIVESARYSLSKLFTYLISALQDNIVLHSFNSWLKTALHGVGDYNDSVASVMLRGFRILVSYTPLALKHSDKVSSDKQDSMDLVCLLAKSSMPLSTLSILHSQNQVDQFIVASINEMSITKLRQYQWEGVSWITMLRRNGLSGILADEMGLGKTLQTLYCILIQSLESLYMKYPSSNWISMQQALREIKSVDGTGSKVLIIAPASLVHQWKEEISKHFSNCILFNPILCLPQNKDWLNSLQYEQPNSVFIASFDTVRSYSEDFASPVWDVIVIDEAHCIRNPSSQLAKCIFALRGKHRIALSGTPLQNQVQDIWSLMNFVMHGYLGDQEKFKREYEVPIKRSLRNLPSFQNMPNDSKNASKGHERKVCMTSEGIALLRSLQKQVLPFILRRTKEEVLDDLPPKTLVDVPCPLSSVQRSMYEEVLQKSVVKEEVVVGSWQRTEAPLHGEDSSLDAVEFYCNISRSKKKSVLIKPAATSSVSTFSALRCLSLLAVHPALVIPQAHQAYRKSLLDNLSCSGKVLRLLRLLWELHITSDDEMVQGFGSLSWYDQLERNLQVSAVGKLTSKAMDDSQDEGDKDDEDEDRLSASAFSVKKSAAKKCLIFAQHHDTLNILESAVFQRYLPSVRYAKLDGTMSPEKRFSVVQNFNKSSHGYIGQELDNAHTRLDRLKSMLPSTAVKPSDNDHVDDIRILLLTTKACGLGLNLTAADTVIFIEHDWNPFVDSQAMDRVHRLGQINPVTVYRLIADATIEARLLGLQNFKQYVSREILPGNNDKSGDKDEELWKSFLTK